MYQYLVNAFSKFKYLKLYIYQSWISHSLTHKKILKRLPVSFSNTFPTHGKSFRSTLMHCFIVCLYVAFLLWYILTVITWKVFFYEQLKVDKSYILHIRCVYEGFCPPYYHIYHKKVDPASTYNHIYCNKSNLSCIDTMWIYKFIFYLNI